MTGEDRDRRDVDEQREREGAVQDLELKDPNDTEAVKGGFNPQPDPPGGGHGRAGQPI